MIIVATAIIVICSLLGSLGLKERVRVKTGQEKYEFKNLFDIIRQSLYGQLFYVRCCTLQERI